MSASSVRRLKGRTNGGTTKPSADKPSKTLTPISHSAKTTTCISDHKSSSTGKENPRPTTRVPAKTQKPILRPVPCVDKDFAIAVNDGETRVRKSTSSVPRGRSSSPSDFIGGFSNVRRDRRVSVSQNEKGLVGDSNRVVLSNGKGRSGSGKQKREFRDLSATGTDGSMNGLRIFRDLKESGELGLNVDKISGISKEMKLNVEGSEGKIIGVRALGKGNGETTSRFNLVKSYEVVSNDLESNRNKNCSDSTFGVKIHKGLGVHGELKKEACFVSKSNNANEKLGMGVDLCLNEPSKKPAHDGNIIEMLSEKSLSEEGHDTCGGNKYPSKLHEKLAFLEGKVKRIASDIKRTKEMLDMNNPEASKVVLSDIQNKISGIEKAMVQVTSNSDGKVGLSKGNEEENKMVKSGQHMYEDNVKNSVKELNTEELEARFFPHYKLIKHQAWIKKESGSSGSHELHIVEPTCEMQAEDVSLSPTDVNPIALEFLASLNKEQNNVTTRNEKPDFVNCKVKKKDSVAPEGGHDSSDTSNRHQEVDIDLNTDETLEEFDSHENDNPGAVIHEETEDDCLYQLNEIGYKTSTGGWFVSEGEAALLAHDDGSCSFYDIIHCEEKAEFKPPAGVSPNMWRDCWIIRAAGVDGCSGRYVVAASAGNTLDSGFCSWDFFSKEVRAFQTGDGVTNSRAPLASLPNNTVYKRNASCSVLAPETERWWYRPCGPLIISTATCQKGVKVFDIRDGEEVMKWEVQKPVLTMDHSSPLQWRNRGKIVIAEAETISLWDVNSLNPWALQSVSSSGRKISALHVNNTDAELGGGVRQRVSSSEAEGNDGVFCTTESINVLDFRHPSGVGLKIPKVGISAQSLSSHGDSIFLGCSNVRSAGKQQPSSYVQQFSLRKQRLLSTYTLPELNAHFHHATITQVWGNSNLVMAVSGLGLFVFDALKQDDSQPFVVDYGSNRNVREIIGQDDLYSPSFDYLASRALLISRDRPATWRSLSYMHGHG